MAQITGWQFRTCVVAGLVLGCAGNNGNQYGLAAAALATTIGVTAIYRSQTGGCWANCSRGYACDRPSGLCHRTECVPECAPDQTCVIEADDRFRCVAVPGAFGLTATRSASASSSAPAASVAPPISSASRN